MITTNVTDGGNFIVYTDDIYGKWSEPVFIPQQGIDPSLLFADDKCYFCGNGTDSDGRGAVFVNEIVPETGESITEPVAVWHGTGGRFLEGPHLYKIGKYYYLMAAEGGTEFGHMEVYARGESPYGPFESYAGNPFLTNKNLGAFPIQGVGHADLVQNIQNGSWWLVHLAFRQIHTWMQNHTIGRETYLVPVTFDENGWFSAGHHDENRAEGTTRLEFETSLLPEVQQQTKYSYTFENTSYGVEWQSLRLPLNEHALFSKDSLMLTGTDCSINDAFGTPAAVFICQKEMTGYASVTTKLLSDVGEAGISVYMDEQNHQEIMLRKNTNGTDIVLRLCMGDIKHDQKIIHLDELIDDKTASDNASGVKFTIKLEPCSFTYEAEFMGKTVSLGTTQSKYLSTEVTGGFVGLMTALFAEPKTQALFTEFSEETYFRNDI